MYMLNVFNKYTECKMLVHILWMRMAMLNILKEFAEHKMSMCILWILVSSNVLSKQK